MSDTQSDNQPRACVVSLLQWTTMVFPINFASSPNSSIESQPGFVSLSQSDNLRLEHPSSVFATLLGRISETQRIGCKQRLPYLHDTLPLIHLPWHFSWEHSTEFLRKLLRVNEHTYVFTVQSMTIQTFLFWKHPTRTQFFKEPHLSFNTLNRYLTA